MICFPNLERLRTRFWRAGYLIPTNAEWSYVMAAIDRLQAAEANEEAVITAYEEHYEELKAEVAALKSAPDQEAAIDAVVDKMTAFQQAASDKLSADTTSTGTGADTTGGGQATDTAQGDTSGGSITTPAAPQAS